MKLLTINTHSLREENGRQKLAWFAQAIQHERPHVIAMQEVNQLWDAPIIGPDLPEGFLPAGENAVPLREGNYAARVNRLLRRAGVEYSWTWLGVKLGYGTYDEGLALFLRDGPIQDTDCLLLSRRDDYGNWKTRKALGVRRGRDWFYCVHMGWWNDPEEPFAAQWARLEGALAGKKQAGRVWLLGDFNSPAGVRGEGYDRVARSGWQDIWLLAGDRLGEDTAAGAIDGWRDLPGGGMRIDHIWCSRPVPVLRARVVFDGVRWPVVSDHFGVLAETDGT